MFPTEVDGANQFCLYFIDRDPMTVTFAPAVNLDDALARYPHAVAAVEIGSTIPACRVCRHASRFGNCGVPERAGLAERFMLVKHPQAGAGCATFEVAP